MSYCRFGEGDVYAYSCDGGVQFYVADGNRGLDRLCSTFDEAYQYAKVLRDTHGLDVPSRAIEALKADAIEEAARICGPDGAVAELESENAKLREQLERLQPKDYEGNVLDIADTVHMLRSEYDGDHEWDDVVVELTLTKWGGDRWIVVGSRGEAWACDCVKTGYDEDAYEDSDNAELVENPTLIEVENVKLREQSERLFDKTLELGTENAKLRELIRDIYVQYDGTLDWVEIERRMSELGIEVK